MTRNMTCRHEWNAMQCAYERTDRSDESENAEGPNARMRSSELPAKPVPSVTGIRAVYS